MFESEANGAASAICGRVRAGTQNRARENPPAPIRKLNESRPKLRVPPMRRRTLVG